MLRVLIIIIIVMDLQIQQLNNFRDMVDQKYLLNELLLIKIAYIQCVYRTTVLVVLICTYIEQHAYR